MEAGKAALGAALVLSAILLAAGFVWYSELGADEFREFHVAVEMLTVLAGLAVFYFAYTSYAAEKNVRVLLIALAFLAMAVFDIFHTYAFTEIDRPHTITAINTSIYFWLAARVGGAILLGMAFLLPGRTLGERFGKAVFAATLVLIPLAAFAILENATEPFLPQMFVYGQGLTQLKVALEAFAAALYALCAFAAFRIWQKNGEEIAIMFAAGLVFMAYSGLALMLYSSPYDSFMVIGHVFKLLAFGAFLYAALEH
ncbi:MAG: MASE3 domain-containing protein [Candidatus Micrarchaeota archaeon]